MGSGGTPAGALGIDVGCWVSWYFLFVYQRSFLFTWVFKLDDVFNSIHSDPSWGPT